MKNISPISPLYEITPEESPSSQRPIETADNSALQPENLTENPVVNTMTQPSNLGLPVNTFNQPDSPMSAQAVNPVYPSPLTSEERTVLRQTATQDTIPNDKATSIGQFGIVLLAGVYSVSMLWGYISALTKYGALGGLGVSSFLGSYGWAALIVGILQSAVLLFASYKVLQGSLVGLALVSGITLMIAPNFVAAVIIQPGLFRILFSDLRIAAQTISMLGLSVLLIWAWTKDKKRYF